MRGGGIVFGPHPDDLELGLGGTIAKHTAAGYTVGLCDLSRGEMGSNGTPDDRQWIGRFLGRIRDTFATKQPPANLLLAPYFRAAVRKAQGPWRRTVQRAVKMGLRAAGIDKAAATANPAIR